MLPKFDRNGGSQTQEDVRFPGGVESGLRGTSNDGCVAPKDVGGACMIGWPSENFSAAFFNCTTILAQFLTSELYFSISLKPYDNG